jgi:hypothetical protein
MRKRRKRKIKKTRNNWAERLRRKTSSGFQY